MIYLVCGKLLLEKYVIMMQHHFRLSPYLKKKTKKIVFFLPDFKLSCLNNCEICFHNNKMAEVYMKKLFLSLLFSALLITFFGCSNPAGGDDDSNTSSAPTWQIQTGYVNSCTWEFSETQAQGFGAGSKITLANPAFTTLTNYTYYAKQNNVYQQIPNQNHDVTVSLDSAFTDIDGIQISIVGNTAIILFSGTVSLEEIFVLKIVFTFNDNSTLEIYYPQG